MRLLWQILDGWFIVLGVLSASYCPSPTNFMLLVTTSRSGDKLMNLESPVSPWPVIMKLVCPAHGKLLKALHNEIDLESRE
jgi:hypothetical protein